MKSPFVISDDFAVVLGHLTMAWCTVEIPLDVISGILFTRCDGASRYEAEIPRSFDKKTEFIKKCFNNLDQAKALQKFVPLIRNAKSLSKSRHRLTHGIVDDFTPVDPGIIKIRRILYFTDRHEVEEHITSIAELHALLRAITELGETLTFTTLVTARHFGVETPV